MSGSSFIAQRQKTALDCQYRAVSGHVCTVLLQCRPRWLLGLQSACQQYKKTPGGSIGMDSPSGKANSPVRQNIQAAYNRHSTQPIAHRSYIPAVSSLGACLTPA